jgi:hypothetical protein
MTLSRQRNWVQPAPGEDWAAIAGRVMPDQPVEAAVEQLRSWNLHLFARRPPGSFTGSDILFTEPPLAPGQQTFGGRPVDVDAHGDA